MSDRELEHEFEIIDRDLSEGLLLMGRALQPLVGDARARGGGVEVGRVLQAVYASEQAIRLRWLGPGFEGRRRELEPELAVTAQRSAESGEERVVLWPPGDDPVAIHAYLPIPLEDGE